MRLWRAGMVSLFDLAHNGPVMGGPVSRWCFDDAHEFDRAVEEDGERWRVCARCNYVEEHPYVVVNGVEVSRRPQGEPRDPMPVAWKAARMLALEAPR